MRAYGLGVLAALALAQGGCDAGAQSGIEGRGSGDVPDLSGDTATGDTGGDTTADVGDDAADTSAADTSTPDTTSTDTGPDVVTVGCAVADELFTPYCVTCHDRETNYPDLTPGALKYLVGAPAFAYPGETLVVAGDAQASLLYRKVHGPGVGEGSVMPPVDELPAEAITALETWIAGGAAACDSPVDPGPMTPAKPAPGAEITFNAAPSGFQTTKPSWADEGTCSASQWWKYQGNTESSGMHPGRDCIGCHDRENEGPVFSYAGTVYPGAEEADDCRGVSGVKVEILDAEDVVLATTTTNTAGNFYWKRSLVPFRPYRARLSYQGRTREMQILQPTSGDCNTCHDAAGNNGAVGRIVAP